MRLPDLIQMKQEYTSMNRDRIYLNRLASYKLLVIDEWLINDLTQDDIENPKPNPEGFLKAMNFFSISKDNVIIFEDSDVGMDAALKCSNIVYKCFGYN